MKKIDKITANVDNNKQLQNRFNKMGHIDTVIFIENADRYIKAIKQGRMICNIDKVSASGMSRNIKFLECSRTTSKGYRYFNFWSLFTSLGFSEVKKTGTFRINGCGMDMIFHTNYSIIHNLYNLGFISNKECDKLAQMTPSII